MSGERPFLPETRNVKYYTEITKVLTEPEK